MEFIADDSTPGGGVLEPDKRGSGGPIGLITAGYSAMQFLRIPRMPPAAPAPHSPAQRLTAEAHIAAFFQTFVRENRRARWLHLLAKNPEKLRRNAYKLREDLDERYLREDKHLRQIADHSVEGAYYVIGRDEACWKNLADLLEAGRHFDAIFSIEAGRLAVLLFHEGQRYVLSTAMAGSDGTSQKMP